MTNKSAKDTERIIKLLKRLDEQEQLAVLNIFQGVKTLAVKKATNRRRPP